VSVEHPRRSRSTCRVAAVVLAALGMLPMVASAPPTALAAPLPAAAPASSAAARLVAAAVDEMAQLVEAAGAEVPREGSGGDVWWGTVGALQQALGDLSATASTPTDPRFLTAVESAWRGLTGLQVAWNRLADAVAAASAATAAGGGEAAAPGQGVQGAGPDSATASWLGALTSTLTRLRNAYGSQAARARQGGALTAAEQARAARLAQAAKSWQASLAAVAAAARRQGDAALLADLSLLAADLQTVAAAQRSTAAYAAALQASADAVDLWDADTPYVEPAEQQAWQGADGAALDLTTAADTGFVFAAGLGSVPTPGAGDPEDAADAGAAATEAPAAATARDGARQTQADADAEGASVDGAIGAPSLLGAPGVVQGGVASMLAEPGDDDSATPGWIVVHGGPEGAAAAAAVVAATDAPDAPATGGALGVAGLGAIDAETSGSLAFSLPLGTLPVDVGGGSDRSEADPNDPGSGLAVGLLAEEPFAFDGDPGAADGSAVAGALAGEALEICLPPSAWPAAVQLCPLTAPPRGLR
jgi:hypothetical protein